MSYSGFVKVASCNHEIKIGNVDYHVDQILTSLNNLADDCSAIVFPQLSLCGVSSLDLLWEDALLDACLKGLQRIIEDNPCKALVCISLPYRHHHQLYMVMAIIHEHKLMALVPKSYLSNEYLETRYFTSGFDLDEIINFNNQEVIFSNHVLIKDSNSKAIYGFEVSDDLYANISMSDLHSLHGANIILNSYSGAIKVKQFEHLKDLTKVKTKTNHLAYVISGSDVSESTSDVVYGSQRLIVDNGKIIEEAYLNDDHHLIYGEINVQALVSDQYKQNINNNFKCNYHYLEVSLPKLTKVSRKLKAYPFIHDEQACMEILNIQATGLAQRLKKINCDKVVIGISGGLDSTLAIIVAKEAFKLNGYDSKNIYAITMPGYGTTKRTFDNSMNLMKLLEVSYQQIPIHDACKQHFLDLNFDPSNLGITFENSQARERTQILMDYANMVNALVIGTGDLSELALGWCTYNGDHMSNYSVNASVSKTLVREIVKVYAHKQNKALGDTLMDIVNTPISPELLPTSEDGELLQQTQNSIGSYDLHDFFIYHMLKEHQSPKAIYELACNAFDEEPQEILRVLKIFYRRFFTQQFKRNCVPDGVKVGNVTLSPRSDLRMPSDASYQLWMNELAEL